MKTLRFARQCGLGEMLVLLALFATPVRADQEGDFIFDRNGTTAALTGYAGPGGAVVIPDRLGNLPVASIGNYAFSGRTDLTSVTIPNSVTYIGYGVFSGCTGLASVIIPNSVTYIENDAFSGCTALTAIEVDSLNLAYRSAAGVLFNKAQSELIVYPAGKAGSYTIPNSVTDISYGAFSGCIGLTSVTIPNSVTAIRGAAFYGCTGLTTITIPSSVTFIDAGAIRPSGENLGAFSGCTGLKVIEVDSLNLAYSSAEGVLFNKTQSSLIEYPEGKAGPYTIPNSVTSIGRYLFSGRRGLTSVTIPNSVTNIGHHTFSRCTALTSVTIPDSVTDIAWRAFQGCTSLKTVTIPNSVTNIWDYAFFGCTALTSITIPQSVTNIGQGAFSGCTGLTSVYFEGNAPASLGGGVFSDSPFATVFYRAGAAGWSPTFADRPTAVWMPRPAFGGWAVSTGLTVQFPNASAEGDDPDSDGFTNGAEWFAATDPTQHASRLELELTPRAADLSASDQTPIEPDQHAVYFRSVPGRYYGVQRAMSLGGAWELQATKVATTAQTRFVLPKPADHGFYRVLALP